MIAQRLGIDEDVLSFVVKQSSSHRKLNDCEEIRSCTVTGIDSWIRKKAKHPHPILIIGAGHMGLRQALSFLKEGVGDFVVVDRIDRVGGVAWVKNANPTSKLQTELGSYHLQYDLSYAVPRAAMKTWPTRDDLLEHFQQVSLDFGIMPHILLNTDVTDMSVVMTDKDKPIYALDRQFMNVVQTSTILVEDDNKDEQVQEQQQSQQEEQVHSGSDIIGAPGSWNPPSNFTEHQYSAIACYPGALTAPLRVNYPGEDVFEGSIGYGMFEEFDYNKVEGKVPAIMGMGAFGVENVRTCLEHGARQVWLICRRKNISMPRVISWFCNQSLYPPPGAMVLNAMKLMYDCIPDDPWSFYSIIANADRTTATIRQKARFGIGDVYFLAQYYGKVELVVDGIKRLAPSELVMDSGERLYADHLIKVLGFRPDESVDKLMGTREMAGFFVNGDWRRWVFSESPGVDAGRFGGTSLSPGLIQTVEFFTWFVNYPRDVVPLVNSGMLPTKKPDKDKGIPAYIWDTRQSSGISMLLSSGIVPGLAELGAVYGPLARAKMLEAHPMEQFIDECAAEWYKYCEMFREPGDDRPFPKYPYTHEFIKELCERNDREGEAEIRRQQERMGG